MPLPKMNEETSYVKIKLPSGKSIGIVGWKVKEEKELLFSIEVDSNSEANKLTYMVDMLKKCVDDKNKFDTLSENDIIKLAIEIRKLSKGDTIEYNYECPHCQNKFFDEVNLTKEHEVKFFDQSPLVVNDKLTLTFRDLDWKTVVMLSETCDSITKYMYKHLINSIDSITFDGTTYTEFTPTEAEEFIDQLKSNDMKKLNRGFEDRLSNCVLKRTVKCIKCKKDIDINFGEILSFLVL